jgi:hypothetical protein
MSREELMARVCALAAENAALVERVAEDAAWGERVAVLEAENQGLRERVARLERLVSRNSGNSGMPPAGDDQPGRVAPKGKRVRGGSGRRPGGQPGARGVSLAWSEDPDTTVDHFPVGACACGADLADAADLGVTARHQQVDVPPVAVTRIQHELHTVACGCGRVHTAARPAGVPAAPVSIGVNLQAWCVYLMVAHAITGAAVRGVGGVAFRRPGLGGVRARHARPGRGGGGGGEPADPGVAGPGVGGVLR